LLDFDSALQNGCVRNADPEIEKKVAPLNRILGRTLEAPEVMAHFQTAFEKEFQIRIEYSELMEEERDLVRSLEPVYKSAGWTQSGCR
jgi:hypothetical protein